jgi:hypothetical protein
MATALDELRLLEVNSKAKCSKTSLNTQLEGWNIGTMGFMAFYQFKKQSSIYPTIPAFQYSKIPVEPFRLRPVKGPFHFASGSFSF